MSKNNFSVLFIIAVIFVIALINAVSHVGLIEDNSHHLIKAFLQTDNLFWGHDSIFYRYFPTIIPHLTAGFMLLSGLFGFKTILFTFTLVSYLLPLAGLMVCYANFPKENKEPFNIVVLSFLITMIFLSYLIFAESILTAIFLWIVLTAYVYGDFEKPSLFTGVCLIAFSFFTVSSHPISVILIPVVLFAGISKYRRQKSNILIASFIILFCSWAYNVFYSIFGYADGGNARSYIQLAHFFKTGGISPQTHYFNRILGLYIPLFFMAFFIAVKKFRYEHVRYLNAVLAAVLFINSAYHGAVWRVRLKTMSDNIKTERTAAILESYRYGAAPMHRSNISYIIVFLPLLFHDEPFESAKMTSILQDIRKLGVGFTSWNAENVLALMEKGVLLPDKLNFGIIAKQEVE